MPRAWLACAVALALASAGAAAARPAFETCAAPEQPSRFWRAITAPHADEVCLLLNKANGVMRQPDDGFARDEEWAVEPRAEFFRDAYHLLRHARSLAPANPEVLGAFARAADELGKTREALDALDAAIRATGAERADWTITGQLGAIQLRLGDADTAIRWLRLAQAAAPPVDDDELTERSRSLVHLAHALVARGQLAAAQHVLSSALPDRAQAYSYDTTLIAFALAVLYDRDEQRASAFDVLQHLQAALQTDFKTKIQHEIARFRFTPAEDLHYYRAFLYESLGEYVEARAEWAHYAAAGHPAWRGRALDHLAAIDQQRRNPRQKSEKLPRPPPSIPRMLPKPTP